MVLTAFPKNKAERTCPQKTQVFSGVGWFQTFSFIQQEPTILRSSAWFTRSADRALIALQASYSFDLNGTILYSLFCISSNCVKR